METVSTRMQGILPLFDLHTEFFPKVLDGISDEDAHKRLDTPANHIAWLTGSLVEQRFDLAGLLKVEATSSANDLFKDFQGIKNGQQYPSLEIFKKDWQRISPLLRTALVNVTDEQLDHIWEFPGMKMPFWDLLTFNIYREANCIGQIALWRRLLNYEPMKYM
ncbi:DinB family protein [Chitinophaga sp.]|uniref:DinB family protein n=1 Tax=Chitinophaga sp. TaxID=1869181 RepID=UPI002CCFDC8C|nr:DinB family protein [Chitinophaga sp.]HWV68688.1 DinB family protein [Chitinophaga sp.]